MARSLFGYPPRLFGFAAALCAVALPIVAWAAVSLLSRPADLGPLLGAALFLGCALFFELKPVSLDIEGKRLVSLAFVFIISAQVLFGWEYAIFVGGGAMLVAQLAGRFFGLRLFFNCSVYVVGVALGSLAGSPGVIDVGSSGGARYGELTARVFAEGAVFIAVNVGLVCAAIALSEGLKLRPVVVDHIRHSGPAFLMMASMAALAVSLWSVYPPLLLLLAGPILTLGLYQRYARNTRVAWQAAETDWLTGLGNRRAYERAIQTALKESTEDAPATLCLIDLDDFKQINDTHGHSAGDEALAAVARRFSTIESTQAFRLGGDEFALVVDGSSQDAVEHVCEVQAGLRESENESHITISVGIASCPQSAQDETELHRLADRALYWTKKNGKSRWCVYSPSVVELSWLADTASEVEYEARLLAAENLVRLLDAREPEMGRHTARVACLAEAIGMQLGLDPTTLEHLQLASRLQDLGTIGVPEEIVHKPGKLTPEERAAARQHPEIGYQLLRGLGIAPVDDWVRHHHERWDGAGYPSGLSGEDIPLGARIIHVADAYHGLTGRRHAAPAVVALAELQREAGAQFDPNVLDALSWLVRGGWGSSLEAQVGA